MKKIFCVWCNHNFSFLHLFNEDKEKLANQINYSFSGGRNQDGSVSTTQAAQFN